MNTGACKRSSLHRGWRLILLAAFVLGLLAPTWGAAQAAGEKIGLVFSDPAGEADMGFNYWASEGLSKAEDPELSGGLGVDGTLYYPATADHDGFLDQLEQCVTDGNILCFAVGSEMAAALNDVATANPGVHFAILDHSYETYAANVRGILFAPKAAGYLAGALAAKFVSGNLGVIGGAQTLPVQKFVEGFRNGAQCARPGVDVWINYTGHSDNDGSGVAAATSMIGLGAEAIFTVAGANGDAALLYTTQQDVYGIGVDTDQYLNLFGDGSVLGSDYLLSSAMKGMDWAVYKTIADKLAATPEDPFQTGDVTYSLGGGFSTETVFEGGSRLAPYHEVTVATEITDYLNSVEASIQAGDTDINYACQPRFHAEIVENRVTGMDWLPGMELSMAIDDPSTPEPGPDVSLLQIVEPNGVAQFTELGGLQLEPGMAVSMSGLIPQLDPVNPTARSLVIDDIAITNVNHSLDTVSGTALPGSTFSSQYCNNGCAWRRYTTVGPSGEWTVDFSVPDPAGTTPEEANALDIVTGMTGETLWGHPEGGITDVQWRAAAIGARVSENEVHGTGWEIGKTVHMSITDGMDSIAQDAMVELAPWAEGDPTQTLAVFDLNVDADPEADWTLQPGDDITLTDGWTERQHTVSTLAVTDIDLGTNTVNGTVESDMSRVEVYTNCYPCDGLRLVTPTPTTGGYEWSAHFSDAANESIGEYGTPTLGESSTGEAYFHDEDGDHTLVLWSVNVQISGDTGRGFVTLTTDDDPAFTTTSDSNGNYTLSLPYGWSGTVTPSKSSCTSFTPASRTYGVLTFNVSEQNYGATCPNSRFHAEVIENHVWGFDWEPGETVTLTIDDGALPGPDFTDTAVVDTGGSVAFLDLGAITLAPEMHVEMSGNVPGGHITKAHDIRDVVVEGVDPALDTVWGTGPVEARLNVQYCGGTGCLWRRWATVDPDGNWEVDFATPGVGEDEQEILNIVPGMAGEALLSDEDGDITDVAWIVTPQISGNTGVGGVKLSYTDGTAKYVTSDGGGNYSFTVRYKWDGTVTPSKSGCTFSPPSRTYSDLKGNPNNQNYTATCSKTFYSMGAQDGWLLESSETSGKAGTSNSADATFNLGDNATKKQYRGILSFDTSTLPDNAVVSGITLRIKQTAPVTPNPFLSLGNIIVDVKKGGWSGNTALQLTDFYAAGSKNFASQFTNTPVSNWYSTTLGSSSFGYIYLTGTTQFRLRFATDDNNNTVANYIKFASGNATTTTSRPQLIITYHVP